MAARKLKGTKTSPWPDVTKDRMRATMLMNRLCNHALGHVDMSPTQVTACLGALRKLRPDLAAVQHSGEVALPYAIVVPMTANAEDWEAEVTQDVSKVEH
jgi:hypothetical protein